MNSKTIFLALVLTGLSINVIFAQLSSKQRAIIDSISVQDVVKDGPGIATGIIYQGKVIYEKYAGLENLETNVPINSGSRFNIASNAKQFTAFAILNLEAQNKLKVSDDIRKYLPKMFASVKVKITIANLLNHSSGIRDVYDLWSLQGFTWWQQTFSNHDAMLLLENQTELNFVPGSKYLYSNSNYILLAEIVKRASGKSFIFYTDQLFKQLNMPNTGFVYDYMNIIGPIAKPYFNFETWTGYNWTCNIHGDGNLFSTLADQLQWEKTLQNAKSRHFPKSLLQRTQQLIKGSAETEYGYGLEFGSHKSIPYKFHEGSTGAWKATTLRFPTKGYTIVTLTNSGKAITAMQSRQVADALLDLKDVNINYLTKPTSAGPYLPTKSLEGIYQTESEFTFRFELRDSALYLIRFGRNDIRLERESPNVFHQWNDFDFKQEFKKGQTGEMQVTVYYPTHAPYSLIRTESNWQNFDVKQLEGVYKNRETGVVLKLKHEKDKSYQLEISSKSSTAVLISPTKLLSDNYSFTFQPSMATGTDCIWLNGDRVKQVRFERVEK